MLAGNVSKLTRVRVREGTGKFLLMRRMREKNTNAPQARINFKRSPQMRVFATVSNHVSYCCFNVYKFKG